MLRSYRKFFFNDTYLHLQSLLIGEILFLPFLPLLLVKTETELLNELIVVFVDDERCSKCEMFDDDKLKGMMKLRE